MRSTNLWLDLTVVHKVWLVLKLKLGSEIAVMSIFFLFLPPRMRISTAIYEASWPAIAAASGLFFLSSLQPFIQLHDWKQFSNWAPMYVYVCMSVCQDLSSYEKEQFQSLQMIIFFSGSLEKVLASITWQQNFTTHVSKALISQAVI